VCIFLIFLNWYTLFCPLGVNEFYIFHSITVHGVKNSENLGEGLGRLETAEVASHYSSICSEVRDNAE